MACLIKLRWVRLLTECLAAPICFCSCPSKSSMDSSKSVVSMLLLSSRSSLLNLTRDIVLGRSTWLWLATVMPSVSRWRMRLEVTFAEVAEMLPLLRLLSWSILIQVQIKCSVV